MTDPASSAHAAAQDAQRAALAAAREHTDAAELAKALERRIASGDLDISPTELTSARELASFAHLRAQGAEVTARRAAEAHRQAQLAELAEDVHAHDADADSFDAALSDLEAALDKLGELGHKRADAYRVLGDRARALGVTDGPPSKSTRGIHMDATSGHVSVGLGASARRVRPVAVAPYVATAVNHAAQRYGWVYNGSNLATRVPAILHMGPGRLDLHDHLRRTVS